MNTSTKEFLIVLIGALPEMDAEVMRGWIDNPVALQQVLAGALCPSTEQFSTPKGEEVKDRFSRSVIVNRSLSHRDAIAATGRRQYVDDGVVQEMPNGTDSSVQVFFFNFGHHVMSDDDLEKEYASCGLIPCDPHALAKVNEDDPAFADEYPNATHWRDTDDKWCFATFRRLGGERSVGAGRNSDSDWSGSWWFAGVRK